MPHILHPYKTALMAGTVGDPSAVINWDFLQSQSLTSFSRTSNATLFDSTGKLTYAPNNLLPYSQAWGSGSWAGGTRTNNAATAPDGTSTAVRITMSSSQVYQSVTASAGRYIASTYIKVDTGATWLYLQLSDGSNGYRAWFNLSTGAKGASASFGSGMSGLTYDTQGVGNGWFRVNVAAYIPGTSKELLVSAVRADTSTTTTVSDTALVWGAQLEAVTYQTTPSTYNATTSTAYYGPRYPYAYNGSTWDAQGLLVEAAGTNLATYSGSLGSSGWGILNTTRSATATGPDGVSGSAQTFTASSAGSTYHFVYASSALTTTSATIYSFSIFAKAGTHRYVHLNFVATNTNWVSAVFDVGAANTAATQTSAGSGSGTISSTSQADVGGGWYRLTLSGSVTGTSVTPEVGFAGAATGNTFVANSGEVNNFNAAGTETVSFYGAQFELGAPATSYIPNLATGTTTRNGEVIQITGTALTTLQGSAGTLVIDQQGCTGYLLAASAANNAPLYYGSSTTAKTNNNSNQSLTATFGSSTFASATKIGVAWDGSGRSLCAVNGTVATDANAFATLTNAYIGSDGSANFANGYIRRIRIWDQRLSDAALKRQTT